MRFEEYQVLEFVGLFGTFRGYSSKISEKQFKEKTNTQRGGSDDVAKHVCVVRLLVRLLFLLFILKKNNIISK